MAATQQTVSCSGHRSWTDLKVLGDHLQGDLEDGLKDFGHFRYHALLQLVDDGRKQAQHFSIPAQHSSHYVHIVRSLQWRLEAG